MQYYEKAKIILKNIELFSGQSTEMKAKINNICGKCVDPGMYQASDKQKYFIQKAYDYISPIIQERKEKEAELSKMSELDKLWEINASNNWDEESGPYKSLSYTQFKIIFKKFESKINKLEKEISELKSRN